MNLSNLQHVIQEKESELARIRQAAVDATLQQEEEARSRLVQALESMEIELERARNESDIRIRRVEEEAAASIERARMEMSEILQHKEEGIFVAARLKMEDDWAVREDGLRDEFKAILTTELENQRTELISHYEAIIRDLNTTMKADEDQAAQNLTELKKVHLHQVEEMSLQMDEAAQIMWEHACEKFSADAETMISQGLIIAEEQCEARDEQISALLDERCSMHKLFSEKEAHIADMTNDLNKRECELRAFASDLSSRHVEEMEQVREDMVDVVRVNDQMECEIRLLRSELSKRKSERTTLEAECNEHRLSMKSFDNEKNRSESRIRELTAVNQLLERELADATKEINDLTANSEAASKKIDELVRTNDLNANKVTNLTTRIGDLQTKNEGLEKKHMQAVAQINTLEQERREYKIVMDDRTKQIDKRLSEALDSFKASQGARFEPVVVHVHGNHGDSSNSTTMNEKLSIECNNLRSKVLHLQRENFRLESELKMNQGRQVSEEDGKTCSSGRQLQEINSLKSIISVMRKEMETAAESNASEGNEKHIMLSNSVLEQQLIQCRAYLDLLLMPRESAYGRVHGDGSDECAFLRSKYRELHKATDELRVENSRLHMMCNTTSVNIDYDNFTGTEIELIKNLEEATNEIEALLKENDKLTKLSNALRSELNNAKHTPSSDIISQPPLPPTRSDNEHRAYEQTLLDAILNDQSRSCESEGSHDDEVVACIGRKPPLAIAANSRPSKTAYGSRPTAASDRATTSQRQSFQRLLNRKKKEIAVEKTKIRNWNVKDPSTNPYL